MHKNEFEVLSHKEPSCEKAKSKKHVSKITYYIVLRLYWLNQTYIIYTNHALNTKHVYKLQEIMGKSIFESTAILCCELLSHYQDQVY